MVESTDDLYKISIEENTHYMILIVTITWWLRWQRIACTVGDLVSIPELGRFPGEENSYPFQYSWTGYNPLGHKESDMSKLLSLSL